MDKPKFSASQTGIAGISIATVSTAVEFYTTKWNIPLPPGGSTMISSIIVWIGHLAYNLLVKQFPSEFSQDLPPPPDSTKPGV